MCKSSECKCNGKCEVCKCEKERTILDEVREAIEVEEVE